MRSSTPRVRVWLVLAVTRKYPGAVVTLYAATAPGSRCAVAVNASEAQFAAPSYCLLMLLSVRAYVPEPDP